METFEEFKEKIKKKGKEGITEYVLTRPISKYLTWLLVKTKISANTVTTSSLLFALAASVFFALGYYNYLVIGAILLYISHVLDVSDGEIARYWQANSQFGAWWDEITDVVKYCANVIGLSLGVFWLNGNVNVLYFGSLAIMHILLMNYIKVQTYYRLVQDKTKREPEVKMGSKFFFGITCTVVYLMIFAALLNYYFDAVYYLIVVLGTLGALTWLMKLYSGYKQREVGKQQRHW